MLTGRCKQDFEKWFEKRYPDHNIYFVENEHPFICETSLIVEWFDSVGVYISIEPNFNIFEKGNPFSCFRFFIDMIHYGQAENRQEATKAAIEKSNELYNEKYANQ